MVSGLCPVPCSTPQAHMPALISGQESCHSFDCMFCVYSKSVFLIIKGISLSWCRSLKGQHYGLGFWSLWIVLNCCHFLRRWRMRADVPVSTLCCQGWENQLSVTAMHMANALTQTSISLVTYLVIDKLKQSLLFSLSFLTLLSSVCYVPSDNPAQHPK